MDALPVTSTSNNNYVRTAVAQQRVVVDRGNINETEAQLEDYKAQLDEDLTYLGKLERRNHELQQLEGSQAQTAVLDRIERDARTPPPSSRQTSASLSAIFFASPSSIGSNINVLA